jgi:hypothetical protein
MNQEATRARAEADFDQVASNTERFPFFSRLSRQERVKHGWDIVAQYHAAGIDVTDEQVASVAEAELKRQVERLTGALPGAAPAVSQPPASAKAGDKSAAQGASLTLSSDLSANAAVSSPESFQERVALAAKQLANSRAMAD